MTEHVPLSTHKRPLTRRRVLGACANYVVDDAFLNGRPRVTVNDWVSAVPTAPPQPNTRSLPTGSYRGNNHMFVFDVPSSAWRTDTSQYRGTSFDAMDLLA